MRICEVISSIKYKRVLWTIAGNLILVSQGFRARTFYERKEAKGD